jgi:hypothetical protein
MTHKPEYYSQGQFTQDWPQYQQLALMDDTRVEIYLQDVMTPADEKDLDIAKEMLTRIGIQC